MGLGNLFINLPGSKNGSLPSPNSLSESDHFSIGYGYGLSVSLMHLVNAYTILANIGSQTQLKYITNTYPDHNKQVLDGQISNIILDMMSELFLSDGTGKKASVSGYTVYGKTGTVRKIKNGEYTKIHITPCYRNIR